LTAVHHRTCSLCDALCRIRVEVDGQRVGRISGLAEDPFSFGHVCPKVVALKDLHDDPERLRAPLRRRGRDFEEIGWDEALDEAADRLAGVRRAHGPDAVGVYVGNPNVHHYGNLLALALLLPMLGTRARFSAQSVDNLPHQYASERMFGHPLLIGVPDVDRADLMLVLGANPWVSNGGGMASGDARRRMRAIRARGGKIVVIDPRRTETAAEADAHLAIRPGSDALLLLAMAQVLFADGRIADGPWRSFTDGVDQIAALAARFPPERVADATGLSADTIRGLARSFSDAPRAVIYARMGVCTQIFGGLAAWLVMVLHALTGNLDQPGGLMFPRPAVDLLGLLARLPVATGPRAGATRGAALPGFSDELPLVALADEIERPGPGQIRAMLTIAGNPALSAPNGPRVAAALATLEHHVAIDMYLNETSRLAHLVLPAASPLEREHYPLGTSTIAVRNLAAFSERLFAPAGARDDADLLSDLAGRLARAEGRPGWRAAAWAFRRVGPRRLLDLLLRVGPYGRWRGGALDLDALAGSATTVDLGPMTPSFPARLCTPGKRVRLAPAELVADVARLDASLAAPRPALVLIGRRQVRTSNSWLHHSPRLTRGDLRCALHLHPADAAARGIGHGDVVALRSRIGEVRVTAELTEAMRPGVVSLPHGWGATSANDVVDDAWVDPLTGTAALFGGAVEVVRVGPAGG
jgi:anaerobic selenocysteine-containing dehydrogenase